ncbi:hypothetical protein Mtc_1256 [Methanocella conradii HZ254]|uniref:Uncharacterized protein n=1 Tax=Methanocella conradii (strain DSM 24694 / JCM 17849 / CGMCC 1.5162 / HZ254) TaxID=1041930 RepID=H8I9G5_METCZ|nr:hypothetical protein [Methanocella conradii]AFD00010.1 hypothetical protein Mtc_1256 [Methanocella conradii HZ254]
MSSGRSLSRGGFSPSGSLTNVLVVALVVIVLLLCAGVFLLYNQEKGASNDARIARDALNTMNMSYNDLSNKYAALAANCSELKERYDLLQGQYDNVSSNYAALKNQSDTMMVKLGEFLESDPTVAYNYEILLAERENNTTVQVLTVNVYNVCNKDMGDVNVKVTIRSMADNSTGELVKTIKGMPSLSKRSVEWELDSLSRVQSVWVGLG